MCCAVLCVLSGMIWRDAAAASNSESGGTCDILVLHISLSSILFKDCH